MVVPAAAELLEDCPKTFVVGAADARAFCPKREDAPEVGGLDWKIGALVVDAVF